MLAGWALLAVLSPAAAGAAGTEYTHRVWRIQDGLPQNKVQAISQTPEGYLWIGTSGGLVRFDGVRFVVFDRSNTAAFRDDSVLSLWTARDGSLWIGTEGGGLVHYSRGSFQSFGAREGLSNGFVRAVREDRQRALWVATDRGFFRLLDGRFIRLDGGSDLPFVAGTAIEEDRAGRIWVGSTQGLLAVTNGRLVRHRLALAGSEPVVAAIHEDRAGVLWLTTQTGLLQWSNGRGVVYRRWNRSVSHALAEDHEGNLWIGTFGEGLLLLRNRTLAVYGASSILPDSTISAAFEDREQNLWFGTQDGLLRLSKAAVGSLTRRDGVADDNVCTVSEDRTGALWIATITGQLYRLSRGKLAPFHLPVPAGFHSRSVLLDRRGTLWVGAAGQGIVRLTRGRADFLTAKDGLMNENIRQLYEDRDGIIWIATGSGLSRWDGERLKTYYLQDGLAYGSVRVVAEDRDGDLLVGTDGGLNRMHQGRFVPDAVFARLGNERIWAIHQDSSGALWLGTRGGGLFRVKQDQVTKYTAREGLPTNAIYQILEDGNHRLWMSGPTGLFAVQRSELERVAEGNAGPAAVVPYGIAEGLGSNQMNGGAQPAGCRSASGDLWFASVKGAVRVDPNQLRISLPAPVVVESIIADDRPLSLGGEILIPPGRGKLEIHYTACSLRSPRRMSFQYRLEGFDDAWTAGSDTRTAYYTNLPPGQYRFRVTATDGAAPGNASEATVSFVWKPHLYETHWFYAMCALALVTAACAALRLYARQTRARYAMLLTERTRLAREMHDTVIQGCVGVSTLLEAASSLQRPGGGKVQELLDKARIQVKLTLDEARQAVWDLRHESLDRGSVVDRLVEFGRRVSAEKQIPVETEVAGTPAPMDEKTGRNLLLVAREAIRNAVAHGHPTQIRIRLCFGSRDARLEIADDGCGFETCGGWHANNAHFGLVGMRERVEQLGGSLVLDSGPGRGTKVIAALPLPRRGQLG